MDASFIEKAIESNRPFRIKTAGGDSYDVPHRDFISFSAKKTTVIVSYERDGREDVAYIPLLTVSSVEAEATEEPVQT